MRILEFMSFDPSWFLTIPGLLITGGVILLLIALIVFIVTSKKDKGNSVDPMVDGSIPLVEGNMGDINQMPSPMSGPNMNYNDTMYQQVAVPEMNMGVNPTPQMAPNNYVDLNQNPSVMPSMPEMAPNPTVMPNMEPMAPNPMPVNYTDNMPIDQTNVIPAVTSSMAVNDQEVIPVLNNQVNNPVQYTNVGNVQPNLVEPVIQPTPTPVVEEPTVVTPNIYGGSNPSDMNNRPIYGGANPLENTSSIPKITAHTAYNGEPIIPNSVVSEVKSYDEPTVPNQATQTPSTPISAESIFNPQPVMPQATVSQPTPVMQPQAPTITPPTPVEQSSQNNTIETLDF